MEARATTDHAMPQVRRPSKPEQLEPASTDPQLYTKVGSVHKKEATSQLDSAKSEVVSAKDASETSDVPTNAAKQSWIGWLAGSDSSSTKAASPSELQDKTQDGRKENTTGSGREDKPDLKPVVEPQQEDRTPDTQSDGAEQPPVNGASLQRRSWLPIWNNATAAQSAPAITSPTETSPAQSKPISGAEMTQIAGKQPEQLKLKSSDPTIKDDLPASQQQATGKPSAWVFWSREKPAETRSLKDAPREGEVAVANTASEGKPRRASLYLRGPPKPKSDAPIALKDSYTSKNNRNSDSQKTNTERTLKSKESTQSSGTTKVENKAATATAVAPTEAKTSRPASPAPPKKTYEHLLLPSLQDTLKLPESPGVLQQLAQLLYSSKEPDLTHLNLVRDPPRIKNALAIGVHGYFPAPLIQSVLGRPTGTSIKFADMAAKSIGRYTKARGYECNVKTAALDGEGKIADRLDLLWKLLLNWIEEIRRADFIMIACHSQGVPVAIMLVAKLIHFGCISSARVGICAMAGVSMGPFPEFKSRWISGSAGELFEFADPNSKVSTDYVAALEDVLKFGVRLTYIGSIDDQLVSLESSIFAPISHPHIYRAVSIDSRLHAPSFVSHLVAFALKLRNLGVQDHGLIRELSAPLAGSLYSGDGHSRLYEDDAIYDLGVAFALQTTSMPNMPLIRRNIESAGSNPYILPFAMRGILEEDFVKLELQEEVSQLLRQFDEWMPQTKALKDVKFRLEGIRSKL